MDKNFKEYHAKKDKASALLEDCSKRISDEKIISFVKDKKEKMKQDRFIVSVFGHFSNGKSTFLNSLMGFDHEVLKEDDIASTATITRLKYACKTDTDCDKADVIFKDGTEKRINRDELSTFVARNGKLDVERTISEVILYIDSKFLENGVEIVDTPGVNSTYQLHGEIARRQVEKSDAAIFLFSCEKPGNSEELEFLKTVSRHMNRVFFVLNKFDLSDDQGRTEKESIFDKMKKLNIDTEGKRMFPLSAKRAKEALREKNGEKLEASGLPEFEEALISYLTGENNTKDRIVSPLSSVQAKLEEEKESVRDQIISCNKDRNELNTEIQKRKDEIKEREFDLSGKRRHISSSVKSEIQETKSEVRRIVKEVNDKQRERLSKLNSKFDMRFIDFEDMDLEASALFSEEWEESARHLENQLLKILDTSIDSEVHYEKISDSIAAAIRSHLQLEQISIEKPSFDFSGLAQIDEEIKKAKEEYDKAYNKVSNLYAVKSDKSEVLAEIEKLEKDLERMRFRKEKEIERLSSVQVEYGYEYKTDYEYVKRNKIAQKFLGDKRVEVQRRERYADDRAKKAADAEIEKIERFMKENSLVTNDKVEKLRNKISNVEYRQIEREIARAETEEQLSLEELMGRRETQREEKHAMEKEIICVEKDKYLRELKKVLEEMAKNILSFLDQSQKNFVSILSSALDMESDSIEREKRNIEKMVSMNDKTPEEIEQQIRELNSEELELTECIKAIDKIKEEINL